MKIVFVVTRSDAVGGAQIHIRDFSIALKKIGHDPVVLVGGNGNWIEDLKRAGISCLPLKHMGRSINPLRDLRALLELCSTLKQLNPDIVSTHTSKAGWLGRVACKLIGMPVLFTAHGWSFTEGVSSKSALMWRMLERLVGGLADHIITVSRFDRSLAIGAQIASPRRITAIHNGMPDIPLTSLAQPGRASPKMIMVARFEGQKDHATLLHALSELGDLEWTMDFVGSGPTLEANVELCKQLGLSARVNFLGVRSDVAQLLCESQIFVLSTHYEGLPRSIIESMRAGLPAVATSVAGIPELIEDGLTGYLTGAANPTDLASKLRLLLSSAELRQSMGTEARARYVRSFQFTRMLDLTIGIYQSTLRSRSGAPAALFQAAETNTTTPLQQLTHAPTQPTN
ncbi:MAG: glycosyltransferase family 4 protein [Pseudomonadota bacterium]